MRRVVTLTLNPTVDTSCEVDQVVPERKLRCREVRREPGGGGINVARVIQELGGQVFAVWTSGGTSGDLLRQLLDDHGLLHEAIEIHGYTRDNLTVEEERSGQRFRFVMPGPELSGREVTNIVERVRAACDESDFLVLSGSLPPGVTQDFYGSLARKLSETVQVILDTSGPALAEAISAGVDLVKPNLRELGALTGREVTSDEQIADAANDLVRRGRARAVVVSLGAGGALWVDGERSEHVRSPTVPQRSKVGAGDSMVAGMVLGLARGEALDEAVRLGVAAGAAAVMTPGTALCSRSDVEDLRRRMQW